MVRDDMTPNKNWSALKKTITAVLCLLLAADVALVFFLWHGGRQGPASQRAHLERLTLEAKLLKADVQRGEKIRASLPQVGKDCDGFYQGSFLPSDTGYSAIVADLSEITRKAGLKTAGVAFQQKVLKDHGVTQISMKTTVEGDYPSLIQFNNALERSKYFYLLDNLTLASAGSTPGIKLNLDLRTFFRT